MHHHRPTANFNLIVVRPGQSEENLANKAFREGNSMLKQQLLQEVSSQNCRLTEEGIADAKKVGLFLRNEFTYFDATRSSCMPRALETAVNLVPGGAHDQRRKRQLGWRPEPLLRERPWGDIDHCVTDDSLDVLRAFKSRENLLTWCPDGCEHFLATMVRAREVLRMFHAQKPGNVLLVTHAEMILALRAVIEDWNSLTLPFDHESTEVIHNCGVLHYAKTVHDHKSHDPYHFDRMRATTREHPTEFSDWEPIVLPEFSDDDIMKFVEQYPRVLCS